MAIIHPIPSLPKTSSTCKPVQIRHRQPPCKSHPSTPQPTTTHRDRPLGLFHSRKLYDWGNRRTPQLCQPPRLLGLRSPRLRCLARSTASSAGVPEATAQRLPWPCEWVWVLGEVVCVGAPALVAPAAASSNPLDCSRCFAVSSLEPRILIFVWSSTGSSGVCMFLFERNRRSAKKKRRRRRNFITSYRTKSYSRFMIMHVHSNCLFYE